MRFDGGRGRFQGRLVGLSIRVCFVAFIVGLPNWGVCSRFKLIATLYRARSSAAHGRHKHSKDNPGHLY